MSNFSRGDFDIVKERGPGFKRFREANNISLEVIADLSGLSQDTLRAVEADQHDITMEIASAYRDARSHFFIGQIFGMEPAQVRLECQAAQVTDVLGHIGALLRDIREQHSSALSAVAERFKLTAMALDNIELGRTAPGERILAAYHELLREVFAMPSLPAEARELLEFIRADIIGLSRAKFARQIGVSREVVRRLEKHGRYQPGLIAAYKEALARFKSEQERRRYPFPIDLINFRKRHRVRLRSVGAILGISESGMSQRERRQHPQAFSIEEILAYLEAVYIQKGGRSQWKRPLP